MKAQKITPREATDEMRWAAERAETRMVVEDRKAGRNYDDHLAWCVAWQAMYDAAPDLPSVEGIDHVLVPKRTEAEWLRLYVESPEVDPGAAGPSFLAGFAAALKFVRAMPLEAPVVAPES